jgi:ribosomal protein S27E
MMETLDGNAVGGLLRDIFGQEMTAVRETCASCGSVAVIAETVVYPSLPGAIVRCPTCAALLIAITRIHGIECVDLMGIAALDAPAPA